MDLEYDRKFAEMKKYIPFLESMINRLESNSSSSNPRQAQLDKIRSLRDLLLDKKKRMKMDNLLKCEQVLINLYLKVEQKDSLPGIQKASNPQFHEDEKLLEKKTSDLNSARNKLKVAVAKIHETDPDSLPEIARATEAEIACSGSKEPALFQRRPNKPTSNKTSLSPIHKSPGRSQSKRNYTRVLVSPDRSAKRWSQDDPPPFTRRSLHRSPRKKSPSHNKKEKNRGKQRSESRKSKMNITLKVPEESLSSLNTTDILSRIIKCSDGDVDIDTLRELRTQILGELKQTTSTDDISDLLLRSYKNKNVIKKSDDVEDGELSDSESEAIENIYGSLVVVGNTSKDTHTAPSTDDKDDRKIQICLVINSDKDSKPNVDSNKLSKRIGNSTEIDVTDFETYKVNSNITAEIKPSTQSDSENSEKKEVHIDTVFDQPVETTVKESCSNPDDNVIAKEVTETQVDHYKPNFYKPFNDPDSRKINVPVEDQEEFAQKKSDAKQENDDGLKIPLLNEPTMPLKPPKQDVVSQIDILRALKNEILNDNMSLPDAEVETPSLHQPKLAKVASAKEILPKKRISIEKYKEKTISTISKTPLFVKDPRSAMSEDQTKKQSLKLTEKECERFNFPVKLAFDESSDEEKSNDGISKNICEDLAPKSPETEPTSDSESSTPVIIPENPIKSNIDTVKEDVDMRKLMPLLGTDSKTQLISPSFQNKLTPSNNTAKDANFKKTGNGDNNVRTTLNDPRIRRDQTDTNNPRKNPLLPSPPSFPGATPSMTPNARSYELTPSHQSFEFDDNSSRKHVYAPSFSGESSRELLTHQDKTLPNRNWEDRSHRSNSIYREASSDSSRYKDDKYKYNLDRRDDSNRMDRSNSNNNFAIKDAPMTPVHSFGRLDGPSTPSHQFGRSDCPSTPIHPFGRSDMPRTPSHPFGRSEMPMTPSHPFGRSEMPRTPSHSFGRSDMPMTPTHPFGRSEAPGTPNHYFGRSDVPMEPGNSFGRQDYSHNQPENKCSPSQDPRLNRRLVNENRSEKDRFHNDRSSRTFPNRDEYRDHNTGKSKQYEHNTSGRFNNERMQHRESSVGRAMYRDNDVDRPFAHRDFADGYYNNVEAKIPFQRGRSASRSTVTEARPSRTGNKMSVKPHAGRSFTIDTSINSTFQEIIDKLKSPLNNFDSRRQRAASVGRTLTCEPNFGRDSDNFAERRNRATSVGRSLTKESSIGRTFVESIQAMSHKVSSPMPKHFNRAKSVGRDMCHQKTDKSFRDIKAEFMSFKSRIDSRNYFNKHKYAADSDRTRKDSKDSYYSKQNSDKYSPRKNYRDPRMRKDFRGARDTSRHHKTAGIVYSNENIAKGIILKSGSGVKNYKIPKIKRPVEEKPVSPPPPKPEKSKEKIPDPKLSAKINRNKKSLDVKTDKVSTNTTTKDNEGDKKSNKARDTKRIKKKAVIHDSDSETEGVSKDVDYKKEADSINKPSPKAQALDKTSPKAQVLDKTSPGAQVLDRTSPGAQVLDKINTENKDNDDNISNLDLDLDLFKDTLVSDPVLDNINALIEDLDNDLNNTKNEDCDSGNDTLVYNIQSGQSDEKMSDPLDEISKLIEQDLKRSFNTDSETVSNTTESNVKLNNIQIPTLIDAEKSNMTEICNSNLTANNKNATPNDATVSTSETDGTISEPVIENRPKSPDVCSTPDSTIQSNEMINKSRQDDGVADSTNEISNEQTSSDVTSTNEVIKDVAELSAACNIEKNADTTNSIDDFVSLLQDKPKLQKLLSMLGDHSDSKIKKKLELLMSADDDDEDNSSRVTNPLRDEKIAEDLKLPDKSTVNENIEEDTKDEEKIDLSKEGASINTEPVNKLECDSPVTFKNVKEKTVPKKKKSTKRGRKVQAKSNFSNQNKRLTRSGVLKTPPKKSRLSSRELNSLHENLREVFSDDINVLNSTGIRMCRLAKMVDDKPTNMEDTDDKTSTAGPVVVLQKFKEKEIVKGKKKPTSKPESQTKLNKSDEKPGPSKGNKVKPGPKSKNKSYIEADPYAFESDSQSEKSEAAVINKQSLESKEDSSDSDSDSMVSSKSFESGESSETLHEPKKIRKRKRGTWKSGVIKPKHKKKKFEKTTNFAPNIETLPPPVDLATSDIDCFTDKSYCFKKNVSEYSCRLCVYVGTDIVNHYKKHHPHCEIPLSRMSVSIAKEAIDQCEKLNMQSINKIPTDSYVCRFCCMEFKKTMAHGSWLLETFFWHIVSMHTGEYKQDCYECVNNECPLNLDIPPPPKNVRGQLIGYICGKCNYTQVSLENLKTHVIVRHNDEQTEVYMINLAHMNKKFIDSISKRLKVIDSPGKPRVLRSTRSSNLSSMDASDDQSDFTDESHSDAEILKPRRSKVEAEKAIQNINIKSKIAFEPDETPQLTDKEDEVGDVGDGATSDDSVKVEGNDETHHDDVHDLDQTENCSSADQSAEVEHTGPSDDIFDYPHFNISYTESGSKEYVCCINGNQHYRTALLISMKKHVQTKHDEKWDGFCYVCKVIVTTQGEHNFKECLQHYLDKHMDDFPVLEKPVAEDVVASQPTVTIPPIEPLTQNAEPTNPEPLKTYINVRPLSELIEKETIDDPSSSDSLPKISSIVSLGADEVAAPTPSYPQRDEPAPTVEFTKYEEVQAEVMTKKHRVVLDAMLPHDKLVRVYKCAGRFCSFTSDSAENALLHASTHQRIGGEKALDCAYCDFDCAGNAIDLVMHVFKVHGNCKFVCSLCFYRASASQLVGAHYERVHKKPVTTDSVLKTTLAPPVVNDPAAMLTRKQAVLEYVCCSGNEDTPCEFRTYTPGKFGQHLLWTHPSVQLHKCFKCDVTLCHAELIQHMKVHDIQLYQCAWCVHGAENEEEMLAHSSQKHPCNQPQAYLRIITIAAQNTENQKAGGMRVLPLAHLTKAVVPFKEVTPNSVVENPNREAEKSIDLEKLIALTAQIPEARPVTPNKQPELESPLIIPPQQEIPEITQAVTPPPNRELINVQELTPVLKVEAPDESDNHDVICLDSDDEVPVEVAKTPEPPPEVRVPLHLLMRCGQCKAVLKTIAAFKRHVMACFKSGTYKCAYCAVATFDREELIEHYTKIHSSVNNYRCGTCGYKDGFLYSAKKHMKTSHGVTKVVVTTQRENGELVYMVNEPPKPKEKPAPKRKLSTGTPKKRFGPQDIDQLPINPILDDFVYCAVCEFNTKVRLNLVRHLQLHAEQQPVPQTAPVNPVPHLETNERHFDKMLNLASSSLESRPEKPRDVTPVVPLQIPPEAASRYPKYVPERQRHTCGAKGCSYISVDEAMLKRHWEALHEGTNNYHCVHCPPYQHLDTSIPLTASRVIAHLKMHDVQLFACSSCSYYHHKRRMLEKHLHEAHNKNGQVLVVREEGSAAAQASTATSSAPTMDLKAWQCGLCKFKSMLRPEVVDHCYKTHHSRMQFKCSHCPFRTSTLENVTKHQSKSHPDKSSEIFYYYYREGSIPDGPDGTPRWLEQRQKVENPDAPVKTEVEDKTSPVQSAQTPVDLNLVKKEVDVEDDYRKFGEFCDPNGLKYKCPLCSVVTEDNREQMQCHLYEELKYRKWGCSICNYKAFHKTGLKEHLRVEHRQNRDPIELPVDTKVETWVMKLLEHQSVLIEKNREKLAKQRIQVERPQQTKSVEKSLEVDKTATCSDKDLENEFGPFGAPFNMSFTCPNCPIIIEDENAMQEHLEGELTRIRWNCSSCSVKFQNYHEAQFHCKSVHSGQSSRPVEAIRNTNTRNAWVQAVIRTQKQKMTNKPVQPFTSNTSPEEMESPENSLLVVRYEQRVPTPDAQAHKRKHLSSESDSADDELVIDDPDYSKKSAEATKTCPYCSFSTKYSLCLSTHVLRHYNLKPLNCHYCDYNGHRATVENHHKAAHPNLPLVMDKVKLPDGPPLIMGLIENVPKKKPAQDQPPKLICLVCEKLFTEADSVSHKHEKLKTVFRKKGDVTVKCGTCLSLHADKSDYDEHHRVTHPEQKTDYSYFKIQLENRQLMCCGNCSSRFRYRNDLKSHHDAVHSSLPLKFTIHNGTPDAFDEGKRKADTMPMPPAKRVAKKSTTKLPVQRVAKKSTTKLPLLYNEDDSDDNEYSYYGTKPASLDKYENITTLMSFCNTMVPFTLKNLSGAIKIDPKVVVKDFKK